MLPILGEYFGLDNQIVNTYVQTKNFRNGFFWILQNLHFTDNTYDNDRAYKRRIFIDNVNLKFTEVFLNDKEQIINKHMVKFKERSIMKQCNKSK